MATPAKKFVNKSRPSHLFVLMTASHVVGTCPPPNGQTLMLLHWQLGGCGGGDGTGHGLHWPRFGARWQAARCSQG
eukprot:1142236-Rhodomonas_salina.1